MGSHTGRSTRVTRGDLERRLAEIDAEIEDPREGLWGPESATWRLNRELINFAGGGRAALLQLAHPYVAQAIADHSDAVDNPRGRFRRTFEQIFAMTFGDRDAAFASARRVHAVHTRIGGRLRETAGAHRKGTAYAANDVAALLWVHATLVDTVIAAGDELAGGIAYADKERFYRETRRGAALFGIPRELVPPDYPAFRAYFEARLSDGTVAVTGAAREIAGALLKAPSPALAPAAGAYRLITTGLLPESLRNDYGFRFGQGERLAYRAVVATTRSLYRAWPESGRYLPAYTHAALRVGRGRAGALAWALERALARLDFWPAAPAGGAATSR